MRIAYDRNCFYFFSFMETRDNYLAGNARKGGKYAHILKEMITKVKEESKTKYDYSLATKR